MGGGEGGGGKEKERKGIKGQSRESQKGGGERKRRLKNSLEVFTRDTAAVILLRDRLFDVKLIQVFHSDFIGTQHLQVITEP